MKSVRMYVRVEDTELAAWKECAIGQGVLLSEWVRSTCNQDAAEWKGSQDGKDSGSGTMEPERGQTVGAGKRRKAAIARRGAKPGGVDAKTFGTGLEGIPQGQGITPKNFRTQRVTSRDDACTRCGHARIKHRDSLLACLENVCRCPGFVEAEMAVAG